MHTDREPMLQKSYHIRLELFQKAFVNFQKRFVYPRNWLLTTVLCAIALIYLDSVIKNPSNHLAMLLIVVCVAMITILWVNPKKVRKTLFASMKELENDTYHVCFFEDGMTIRTEDAAAPETEETASEEEMTEPQADAEGADATNGFNPLFDTDDVKPIQTDAIEPTEIRFQGNVKVYEYSDYFMVYLVKQMFYVVPKEAFTEDEIIRLQLIFTEGLGEKYHPMK
ncbi:MAG: YcxB family protein [Oscillospiraceae bacterium]|nr:YcxB family protein [Oscillospiraceae bacterium]